MKGSVNMNDDRCVMCGAYVPEGRMVCHRCEEGKTVHVVDYRSVRVRLAGNIPEKEWKQYVEEMINKFTVALIHQIDIVVLDDDPGLVNISVEMRKFYMKRRKRVRL